MENAPGGGRGGRGVSEPRGPGAGARKAQRASLEWTKGPLALPCGAADETQVQVLMNNPLVSPAPPTELSPAR